MKVLEIKNNLVKIAYDVKDNLAMSGFVVIEDENTPYVGQIINTKADISSNFAIVKLLFTFNNEGILKSYDGTIPSIKAYVSKLPAKELLEILPVETPVTVGKLMHENYNLYVDKTIFENNLLICSNKTENTNILLDNILKQMEKMQQTCVIFDTNGEFDWTNKIKFGKNFKLPLNYDTINYIYENELNDIDTSAKALIQEILLELQEYTKTLPEGFIPFDTFFSVIDEQYKQTGISELLLLKNKLLKYRDEKVFAQDLKDILNLSIAIEKECITVIDISDYDVNLQNEIISYAYDVMSRIKSVIYSFVKAENNVITKVLLKKLLFGGKNVMSSIICGHNYKYIAEIKENAENIIFFAPLTMQHDFAAYNTFLNKLNPDEFIIYGGLTQNIPLIVELHKLGFDNETENIPDETAQAPSENQEPKEVAKTIPAEEIKPAQEIKTPHEAETSDTQMENSPIKENITVKEEIQEPELILREPVLELSEEPLLEINSDTIEPTPVVENIQTAEIPEQPQIKSETATAENIETTEKSVEENIEEKKTSPDENLTGDLDDNDKSVAETYEEPLINVPESTSEIPAEEPAIEPEPIVETEPLVETAVDNGEKELPLDNEIPDVTSANEETEQSPAEQTIIEDIDDELPKRIWIILTIWKWKRIMNRFQRMFFLKPQMQ